MKPVNVKKDNVFLTVDNQNLLNQLLADGYEEVVEEEKEDKKSSKK